MSTLPATTSTTRPTTTTLPRFEGAIARTDAKQLGHSWNAGCPVEPEDLRLLSITHWGFDGNPHQGDLVVHANHSETILAVLRALFEAGYPIESVVPIGSLPEGAEDQAGYSNTSGFHCRVVDGTDRWSEHAYGLAIDLNPHLNPFVTAGAIWPAGSEKYVDRELGEAGMIDEGDVVVTAFQAIGWGWGGSWRSLKDYHHFSATGR